MKTKNLDREDERAARATYQRVRIAGQFEIVSESIEGTIGGLTRNPWQQRRSPSSTNPGDATPLLPARNATVLPDPKGRR